MPARRPSPPAWSPTHQQLFVFQASVLHGSKEAAHRLGISERTVENVRANMRRRVGAANGEQLVYMAVVRGWLTIPLLDPPPVFALPPRTRRARLA